jgi:integrase
MDVYRGEEAERLLRVGVMIDDRTTILTDGFGEPLKPAYMSATFRAFVRAHGLDCTYHGLRHTAASLMLASGTGHPNGGLKARPCVADNDIGHLLAPDRPGRPGRRRTARGAVPALPRLASG